MHTETTADSLPHDITSDHDSLDGMPVEQLTIDTIRTLAMDAVEAADSGHPGTPMALAPIAYLLYRQMRYNPTNPDWFDRDRFVLSAGHASMLQYAALHLSGFDLSLDELRNFRQLGSKTPGHPEYGHTPGVETTTGPLGQGLMNAVGMAMAEAHLAAVYNRPGHEIVDHRTYVICSDGDLMEGASHEAGSLAGHLRLGKLIAFYDDNHITIDGDTNLAYSDDVPGRFEAYGWHVQDLGDAANDLPALAEALDAARSDDRPSLIIVRSHIGYGAPDKQDTSAAHGSPLGEEEVAATKRVYGWPEDARFLVPERAKRHMSEAVERGRELETDWNAAFESFAAAHPATAEQLRRALAHDLPEGWDADLPSFAPGESSPATRAASGKALQAIARHVPWLIGGSADLAGSNKTDLPFSGDFEAGAWENRNLHFGIREHVMCGSANGMALHGGVRPYVATFLVFTDYARPAIRLAALMEQPVIYVMTHDSIGLGEDGPTHQPIEHLAALRAIPNLTVIRPADANETVEAWHTAMRTTDGPVLMALTRQGVPVLDRGNDPPGVARGGYVVARERGDRPDVILIGTGSEVSIAIAARKRLAEREIDARVVSLPSWEIFRAQDPEWREAVLPSDVTARVAVEAGIRMGWSEWIGAAGEFVGMSTFGASAPYEELYEHFGITPAAVARAAVRQVEA
ncbi:MAG: transketolase [Gemmatimonadales bacterium]|jgi:transketolase